MLVVLGIIIFAALVWVLIAISLKKAPSDEELWGKDVDV